MANQHPRMAQEKGAISSLRRTAKIKLRCHIGGSEIKFLFVQFQGKGDIYRH